MLAILSLAMVFGGCLSRAPLKGEPFQTDYVTAIDATNVTDEQERWLGNFIDAFDVRERFAVLEPNHKLTIRVNEIGQRLARVSGRPSLGYTFQVLNEPKFANAFATAGGFVYVGTGLLFVLEKEDELAAVLAHEIGHLNGRHVIEKLRNQQQWTRAIQIVSLAVNLGVQVLVNQTFQPIAPNPAAEQLAGQLAGGLAADLSAVVGEVVLRAYSREQEKEADRLGLQNLDRAGYQADAILSMFKKLTALETENGTTKTGFFSTHPSPAERQQTVLQYLKGHQ